VLLLDKPLSTPEANLRTKLTADLKRLRRDLGTTMIIVTHDQIESLTLADRIAMIEGGVIRHIGDPNWICRTPDNRFVAGFMGSPGMNFFDREVVLAPEGRFIDQGLDLPLKGHAFAMAQGGPCDAGSAPSTWGHPPPWPQSAVCPPDHGRADGAETLLWARLGNAPLSVRLDTLTDLDEAPFLTFYFVPGLVSLFNTESWQRL